MSYAITESDVDKLILGLDKLYKDEPKINAHKITDENGNTLFKLDMGIGGKILFIRDENGTFQYDRSEAIMPKVINITFNHYMKRFTGKDWPSETKD